jgi:hypothetical protein
MMLPLILDRLVKNQGHENFWIERSRKRFDNLAAQALHGEAGDGAQRGDGHAGLGADFHAGQGGGHEGGGTAMSVSAAISPSVAALRNCASTA